MKPKSLEILSTLIRVISPDWNIYLKISFEGQAGTDSGGLSRQFIADLFVGLLDAMKFEKQKNGLYRLPPGKKINDFTAEERTALKQLGQLMLFCLNASERYPIGQLFDTGVFAALTKFQDRNPKVYSTQALTRFFPYTVN